MRDIKAYLIICTGGKNMNFNNYFTFVMSFMDNKYYFDGGNLILPIKVFSESTPLKFQILIDADGSAYCQMNIHLESSTYLKDAFFEIDGSKQIHLNNQVPKAEFNEINQFNIELPTILKVVESNTFSLVVIPDKGFQSLFTKVYIDEPLSLIANMLKELCMANPLFPYTRISKKRSLKLYHYIKENEQALKLKKYEFCIFDENAFSYSYNEKDMDDAINEARSKLDYFTNQVIIDNYRHYPQNQFMVKSYAIGRGNPTWYSKVYYDKSKNILMGSEIASSEKCELHEDNILDWLIASKTGYSEGGYTIQLLRDSLDLMTVAIEVNMSKIYFEAEYKNGRYRYV